MSQHRREPLSSNKARPRHRAEDFPVRSWLKVGAASAGMGAALLGFALAGSAVAAAADTGAESSVSSGPADTTTSQRSDADDTASEDSVRDDTESAEGDEAAEDAAEEVDAVEEGDAAEEGDDTEGTDAPEGTGQSAEGADDRDYEHLDTEPSDIGDEAEPAQTDVDPGPAAELVGAPEEEAHSSAISATEKVQLAAPTTAPKRTWSQVVSDFLDDWTADTEAWIDSLDVSDRAKARLEASFYAMRRTFFNQAPTVDPIQLTGVITGPVTGIVNADDPDGDRVVYRLVARPQQGKVKLNADGTYTYTPSADFDGVDTFRVIAIDLGLHVNLLDWFRPLGTRSTPLINQGAIKFDFAYDEATRHHWTADRQEALEAVADGLIWYFRVTKPVVLTYAVTGYDDTTVNVLASASALLTSNDAGFHRTRIQDEIITGVDTNGAEPDGTIRVNFAWNWAFTDPVAGNQFDFTTTLMHELLHSFGFAVYHPGTLAWSIYASLMVDKDRAAMINPDFTWNTALTPNTTGQNGGLYFGGANAVAAYGGLVPLYTPSTFAGGSSLHHLDDSTFTGENRKLMNAMLAPGTRIRTLSAVELGILKDLGYQVVPRSVG